jgi:hypothetical protein
MEKVKGIFKHFLISEICTIILAILYTIIVSVSVGRGYVLLQMKSLTLFMLFFGIIFLISTLILNIFLSIIFYFINKYIPKALSIIFAIFVGIGIWHLYVNKDYMVAMTDPYSQFYNYKESANGFEIFVSHNITEIIIFFCLMLLHLLMKFYPHMVRVFFTCSKAVKK